MTERYALLGLLAVVVDVGIGFAPLEASAGECPVLGAGAAASSTSDCASCHATGSGSTHVYDVDYAAAARSHTAGMPLRPVEEVVRRGVYLPDGKLQCLTCHDPASPYLNHIALPPGSTPMPAVNPRDRTTYEDGPARTAKIAALRAGAAGQRLAVTPMPLCMACHAAD